MGSHRITRINPIVLEETYILEQNNSENVSRAIIPVKTNLSRPQLERWICKQICGKYKEIPALVESIRRLHRTDVLNICDYMFARLSGRKSTREGLKSCFIEALLELNLDLKELRKIDKEKLAKINNSSLYKRR